MMSPTTQGYPETVVIQVPKDQIYHVPPPENANIAERHRGPPNKPTSNKRRFLCWFLCSLILKLVIAAIIVCVYHFTLRPEPPTFSIKRVTASFDHVPGSKKAGFGFRVRVEATNPNNVNDIGIEQGDVGFLYKGKTIGKGRFSPVNLGEKNKVEEEEVVVKGQGGFPKELKNRKKAVKFEIDINVGIRIKTWLFTKKQGAPVLCQVVVDSLGQHSRISSQQCT